MNPKRPINPARLSKRALDFLTYSACLRPDGTLDRRLLRSYLVTRSCRNWRNCGAGTERELRRWYGLKPVKGKP